jgi:hypothetical protein
VASNATRSIASGPATSDLRSRDGDLQKTGSQEDQDMGLQGPMYVRRAWMIEDVRSVYDVHIIRVAMPIPSR